MNVLLYAAPSVTLVSRPQFLEPIDLTVNWNDPGTDGEKLAEFAGRLCYMSHHNPAQRTTRDYIRNILDQAHGSVLEHANYSLLLEGVSRSLTHELVRHRAGFAYSQLSQRYVDETHVGFVMPPAILERPELIERYIQVCAYVQDAYREFVDELLDQYADIEDKVHRRKLAREAARAVLPNGTETKIVVTGNVRAWRHFLAMRGGLGADVEIRRLARQIGTLLVTEAPAFFQDVCVSADGVTLAHPKV